jgi:hypothetical protein
VTTPYSPRLRFVLAATAGAFIAVLTLATLVSAATGADAEGTGDPGEQPVLGSPGYLAPGGQGWGTPHPRSIYNGGDPAGDAGHLRWKHWGADTATAHGLIPIFRPTGGYYAKPGRIVLKAERLGSCPDGTYAYTRLEFRVAKRPGAAPSGPWRPWASRSGDICTSP